MKAAGVFGKRVVDEGSQRGQEGDGQWGRVRRGLNSSNDNGPIMNKQYDFIRAEGH